MSKFAKHPARHLDCHYRKLAQSASCSRLQAAVIVLPTIGRDLNVPDARQHCIVSA